MKQMEFKSLQKKAVMITFIFNNIMKMNEVKRVINVYFLFRQFCDDLKAKFNNNYSRIADYENIIFEVV